MKNILIVLIIIFTLLFGGLIIKVIFFPVNTIEKSIDMAYEVTNKTLDADNAIYNYEWFKQQESDIRKCLENEQIAEDEYNTYLESLPDDRTAWGNFEKQEEASLRNSVSALRKLTNKAIEDYNAKTSMANRNIFNNNLPSNISRAFYAGFELSK